MIRTFLGGIAVGIANIIPGVSGGTLMVILGIFDTVIDAISGVFTRNNPNRFKDIVFLIVLFAGAGTGIVVFASVLDILFVQFEYETYFLFIGLIVASLFYFRREFSTRPNVLFVLIGLLASLGILVSKGDVTVEIPVISIGLLIILLVGGIFSGASMILPGISGALVLLLFDKYHLVRTYVLNVFDFRVDVIVPLLVLLIGIFVGVVLVSKILKSVLNRRRNETLSFILGLLISSIVVLIPFDAKYNSIEILRYIASFGIGASLVCVINKGTSL